MTRKTIVIVGGGVGGIVVSNELRRNLPLSHRIVLIEKNAVHTFAPSYLWLMTGDRTPEKISTPLKSLVRDGIEVIHAEVTKIDVSRKSVTASNQELNYDYLVVALGAELAPELIPGLSESAFSYYSFTETVRLQKALIDFEGGTIGIVVCSMPYKCPGAPHEGAMLIADYFQKRGMKEKIKIHLFTPEPQPMPVAGPQLGEAVKQMLATKGISFHPLHKIISVNSQSREISFEGKDPFHFNMLVAIPPHRAPRIVRESGLSNEAGWIPVDRSTLKANAENVYAIGDVTALGIPGRWKPDVPMMLPKAGVFAHDQAEIVAKRITDEINGQSPTAQFCGTGYCMLEAGEGMAGFAYGDFLNDPHPTLQLRNIGRAWHWGKIIFEQWWLAPFGLKKNIFGLLLKLGAKMLRIPIKL
ncbi:MAG: FAD/NAD(P)-binding oxidoreductase [Bacteroidota bacterium]|nr:FAD/NAD(P)-binding oxidoreductase [Bacteroidota bacterium]